MSDTDHFGRHFTLGFKKLKSVAKSQACSGSLRPNEFGRLQLEGSIGYTMSKCCRLEKCKTSNRCEAHHSSYAARSSCSKPQKGLGRAGRWPRNTPGPVRFTCFTHGPAADGHEDLPPDLEVACGRDEDLTYSKECRAPPPIASSQTLFRNVCSIHANESQVCLYTSPRNKSADGTRLPLRSSHPTGPKKSLICPVRGSQHAQPVSLSRNKFIEFTIFNPGEV